MGKRSDGLHRRKPSSLEAEFERIWGLYADLPVLTPEHVFAPPRRFRFDYAYLPGRIAIELEGAIWVQGRHTRGSGFLGDMEKYNIAAEHGWLVFRYAMQHLKRAPDEVVRQLLAAIESRQHHGRRRSRWLRNKYGGGGL